MGNCKDCKDCHCDSEDCKEPDLVNTTGNKNKQENITEYLKSNNKLSGDPTPLDYKCNCVGYNKVPRSACLTCIKSWVTAVDESEVKIQIARFLSEGKTIAASRLESTLLDKKRGKKL